MTPLRRSARRAATTLGLAAILLGLAAPSSVAAPSFEIQLRSDANEIQAVTVDATGGNFVLSFGAGGPGVSETTDLPATASAAEVQAALNAIGNVSAGGGSVAVSGGPGDAGGNHPYEVHFDAGPLAAADVPEITAASGSPPLSGGASTVSVATIHGGFPVYRDDERVDYTVEVTNTAPDELDVGGQLACDPGQWNSAGGGAPTFSYEWRRNGEPIPGESSQSYVTTAADAGKAIQCMVTGTNAAAAAKHANLNPVVVDPQPATGPPESADPKAFASWPEVSGSGTAKRTCTVPANWEVDGAPFDDPADFTFQWLRNGEPIDTPEAKTNQYQPVAADEGKLLQCEVIGTSAGGSTVGVSGSFSTEIGGSPFLFPQQSGGIHANSPVGLVTVELELPGGLGTRADNIHQLGNPKAPPQGWSCSALPPSGAEPAKAVCTREDPLAPGASYPSIVVQTRLGADAPDPAPATATVSGGGVPDPASATVQFEFDPAKGFGIEAFETSVLDEAGEPYTQAGGHPFEAGTNFRFNTKRVNFVTNRDAPPERQLWPIASAKTIVVDAPRGFVGNALAIEELCPTTEAMMLRECPPESAVGGIGLRFATEDFSSDLTVYALEPEFGRPAQFGFFEGATDSVYVFFPRLRPEDGYAISFESAPIHAENPGMLWEADVRLCGFGAELGPNPVGTPGAFKGCKGADDPSANPKPLVTMPTRCDEEKPPVATIHVDSWQNPGVFASRSWTDPAITGCELVEFEPQMELQPTSNQADSPTGMDVEIFMPSEGLESKTGISQANLKRVTVTLPEGMAVNASAGHGLLSCSAAQVGMHSVTGVPNNEEANCPEASKIGTIAIATPLIASKLTGDVYIAQQGADNPFDSNIALYLVFSSKKDGITIKVAGEVKPDPVSGQMTIVFDENPEAPFSRVELNFPAGPRANLINPPRCGIYEIKAELTPWSAQDPANPTAAETVTQTSAYRVTAGPGGGPCPTGALEPKLNAGTTDPIAGKPSPFVMRLHREDGTQRFAGLALSPPQGLTAYLKGIPYCPDAALASISPAAETGQAQIDSPSCPAASLIGHASAGAGAGPNPLYVNTGRVYLAGPYKGAPLSLAVVTPAVAGPLDLGNVVIRTALRVNPVTAQITAVSDPIPTILHGILLNVRDIRVNIDRPNFTLNPTSCAEMAVAARVRGENGAVADVANRFQALGCGGLDFKPRMTLRLKGGTRRGAFPSLRAVVRPRPGEANIRRAAVTLPRSAFLEQGHIRTICTRVQWAADTCPKAARYGYARAWTPLLDQPLRGPVYLRSSDNLLPDLVADLRGPPHQPIKVEAAFRTDSIRGGIRSTIDLAPDAPVSRFVLRMQGGKKGLIVNSRNICRGKNRANARLRGHNGRRFNSRPVVHAVDCKRKRKAKRSAHRSSRQSASSQRR